MRVPPPHPTESWLLEFLQLQVDDGCGGMEGDSGLVIEDVCEDVIWILGRGTDVDAHGEGNLFDQVVVVTVGVMVVVAVWVMSFFWKMFFVNDGGGDGVFRGKFWADGR